MTEAECRMVGYMAREAMLHELRRPGSRTYQEMAEEVERKIVDRLIAHERRGQPVYPSLERRAN